MYFHLPKPCCFNQNNSPFLSCLFGNSSGTRMKFVHTKVHNGNGESSLPSFETVTLQLKQYQGDLALLLNCYFVTDLRKYFFYQSRNIELLAVYLIFLLHCKLLCRLYIHLTQEHYKPIKVSQPFLEILQ